MAQIITPQHIYIYIYIKERCRERDTDRELDIVTDLARYPTWPISLRQRRRGHDTYLAWYPALHISLLTLVLPICEDFWIVLCSPSLRNFLQRLWSLGNWAEPRNLVKKRLTRLARHLLNRGCPEPGRSQCVLDGGTTKRLKTCSLVQEFVHF